MAGAATAQSWLTEFFCFGFGDISPSHRRRDAAENIACIRVDGKIGMEREGNAAIAFLRRVAVD
jgi:hypothetical protein